MKFYNEFLNVEFEIKDKIERVVSLAPDITDILDFLGLFERVVGVSAYCYRPKEARNKPKLGGYLKINMELLKSLNPQVVLTTSGVQRKVYEDLINSGFVIFTTKLANSVFDILDNIIRIGNLFSISKIAYEKTMGLLEILNKLKVDSIKAKYFAEIDLAPEITFGSNSYITHGLFILGLENIFINERQSYFFPNYEEVKLIDPDIIIYEPKAERIKKPTLDEVIQRYISIGLGELRAVKESRIILTPGDYIAHYGPSFITEVLPYIKKKLEDIL